MQEDPHKVIYHSNIYNEKNWKNVIVHSSCHVHPESRIVHKAKMTVLFISVDLGKPQNIRLSGEKTSYKTIYT